MHMYIHVCMLYHDVLYVYTCMYVIYHDVLSCDVCEVGPLLLTELSSTSIASRQGYVITFAYFCAMYASLNFNVIFWLNHR